MQNLVKVKIDAGVPGQRVGGDPLPSLCEERALLYYSLSLLVERYRHATSMPVFDRADVELHAARRFLVGEALSDRKLRGSCSLRFSLVLAAPDRTSDTT